MSDQDPHDGGAPRPTSSLPELDHPASRAGPGHDSNALEKQSAVLIDLDPGLGRVVNEAGPGPGRELPVHPGGRVVPLSEDDIPPPPDARHSSDARPLRARGLLCPPSEVKEGRA